MSVDPVDLSCPHPVVSGKRTTDEAVAVEGTRLRLAVEKNTSGPGEAPAWEMWNAMTEPTTSLGVADIQKIMACIPHRYPFLLVDRVVEINGDESGVGIKNVTINEPQFTGHFPGRPVFPGVLMIEAMAQTAGVLVVSSRGIDDLAVTSVLFTTIDKAKFRKPVVPGDTLRFHLSKIARKRNIWFYRGEARVDGVLVAEADLSAMVV